MPKNYFKILGLSPDASQDEIKRAYRKLALKYHPDKNKDSNAEDRFKEICEAYKFLTENDQGAESESDIDVWDSEEEFEHSAYHHHFPGGSAYTFSSMFSDLFGGASFSFRSNCSMKKGPPIKIDVPVTLEEVYTGCSKRVKVPKMVLKGSGTRSEQRNIYFTVIIKPGSPNGKQIIHQGKGNETPFSRKGDVIFTVTYKTHPRFEVDGYDLRYKHQISLKEALCGLKEPLRVTTLDGQETEVKIPRLIRPGFEKKLRGKGLPKPKLPGAFGNLTVSIDIEFPTTVSDRLKEVLEEELP